MTPAKKREAFERCLSVTNGQDPYFDEKFDEALFVDVSMADLQEVLTALRVRENDLAAADTTITSLERENAGLREELTSKQVEAASMTVLRELGIKEIATLRAEAERVGGGDE